MPARPASRGPCPGGLGVAGAARAGLPLLVFAALVGWMASHRLRAFPYPLSPSAAWTGAAQTAAATVPAALLVWGLVALAIAGVASWLGRRDRTLRGAERALGAVAVLWAGADIVILVLGPLGWYRPLVLRALLAVVVAVTLRPRGLGPFRPWPVGAWIATGALGLVGLPLLLLQIGSPVSPFMDILALVASVQKIVTFRQYDPFANDASGIIALGRGSVGYDAPLSLVALVAGLPAHLAITALILPFCVLQIAALYLLGRRALGATAGGFAALFLLQTFTWRRTPDIRGTCLAFALVATGLAFLAMRHDRRGTRTTLAALTLGTAVNVNPLIGAMGMLVASAHTVVAWLDCGTPLVARIAALAAGSTLALPQVLIGLSRPAPVWILAPVAVVGVAMSLAAGRLAARARPTSGGQPFIRALVLAGAPLGIILLHARLLFEFMDDQWAGYAPLGLLATIGAFAAAGIVWRAPRRWPAAAVPALALLAAAAVHALASPQRFAGTLEARSLASEVTTKMLYYWSPYWLALGAGLGFGALGRAVGRRWAVALAVLLVVYPLRHVPQPVDYDAAQLSVAETWGFNLANAAHGYHAGIPDRRWVADARWREVGQALFDEIAAGRISYDTHVVYVTPGVNNVVPALWTGVSMDPYTPQWSGDNIWLVGTRVQSMQALPSALAAAPPYVLVDGFPASRFPELAASYEALIERPAIALFRRRATAASAPPG